ncbi:PREDICTED: potassium channel subfamily K member 18 [Nicrophorus vespilloides]|uniref:Potassium channel subfamily K member 18 n=1 Tax=Nicrophorus vespilloides TaxID=110193 RepID=A0ABM1MQR8_NICVS|nr:PREDICTED: potassium channel subfamily K member 18 [Nicrophorus vespilloides]
MERQRSLRRRRRAERPLAQKIKDCIRNFIAFMFSNVGIIGLVVGYAIAGAFIFMEIEGSAEKPHTTNIAKNREQTAASFWNLTYTTNVLDKETWMRNVSQILLDYQSFAVDAIRDGYDGTDDTDYSKQWSFSGAFLYSLTVITTIGYGNIVPRTAWGKVATIVYAIIGMPLFLLYLSNIGDIMARSFKWIYATCYLCKGCPGVSRRRAERRRRRAEEIEMEYGLGGVPDWQLSDEHPVSDGSDDDAVTDISEESFDAQTITVPVTICLTMMVGYIVGGAMLFAKYESWDLLNGSYFCFISLSTIGFGDLVPGDKIYSSGEGFDIELSFIFCSMYLMLGMALIAMCFNLMQEEVIHKFRTTVSTLKYICRCNR